VERADPSGPHPFPNGNLQLGAGTVLAKMAGDNRGAPEMINENQASRIHTILLQDWYPLIVGGDPKLSEYDDLIPNIIGPWRTVARRSNWSVTSRASKTVGSRFQLKKHRLSQGEFWKPYKTKLKQSMQLRN
jgi:hypothetical protein